MACPTTLAARARMSSPAQTGSESQRTEDLDRKVKNKSMPGNRRPRPFSGAESGPLTDPCDMAKAGLPDPVSTRLTYSSAGNGICNRRHALRGFATMAAQLWGVERFPMSEFKEMSGTPKSRQLEPVKRPRSRNRLGRWCNGFRPTHAGQRRHGLPRPRRMVARGRGGPALWVTGGRSRTAGRCRSVRPSPQCGCSARG